MKKLHLICNAHLDPVWLWDWEEGVAAALSTFRMAAQFCREYDGFVFNHNEAILYEWVEEYEPALFAEIKELVKLGKWHIMGGWYLQPDCNMPSGESFIRQIETGRDYFREKFGVCPTTAINFDPFGHSRGLVQILKKSGYDSYIFCRPNQTDCPLPDDDFLWEGFDGSVIAAHRASQGYNSLLGEAEKKVTDWIEEHQDCENGMILWGVGNHGGGPSHVDLKALEKLMAESGERDIFHSTPEQFFAQEKPLLTVKKDLNAWAVGCYTAQIRIKQYHRRLEGELSSTEKMLAQARLRGLSDWPEAEFLEVQKDLLTVEFHDILPGSALAAVEEAGLRQMDHGLEILSRLKRRAFYALAQGQKKAEEGEYPILIYNPHPFPVTGVLECEFQLKDQNWGTVFANPVVYQNGKRLPSQVEKEGCNLNLDWRKRVSFLGTLEPSCMNRFDVRIEWLDAKPVHAEDKQADAVRLTIETDEITAVINKKTGLLDRLVIDGADYVKEGAFSLEVIDGGQDPWAMRVDRFTDKCGDFTLLDGEGCRDYCGICEELESVHIIEDGEVRTVVEAVFGYHNSRAAIQYSIPKQGKAVEIGVTAAWNEKGKMLKLRIPTPLAMERKLGETAYGVQEYSALQREMTMQRWCGVSDGYHALTCINDGIYGMDFEEDAMRLTLLHAAAYSAHPIEDRPLLVQDRYMPHMDQGERHWNFRLEGGAAEKRLDNVWQEATLFSETPMAVSFFPAGAKAGQTPDVAQGAPDVGQTPDVVQEAPEAERLLSPAASLIETDNPEVVLTAFRKRKDSGVFMLRLFESAGKPASVRISLPGLLISKAVEMNAFEIKTLLLDAEKLTMEEGNLL